MAYMNVTSRTRENMDAVVVSSPVNYDAGAVEKLTQTTDGYLNVQTPRVSSASLTSVASSASSAQALPATPARKGLTAYNTDSNACYLKYGTTASATSFTVLIPSGGYWEMPPPAYTGRIDVIWAGDGTGSLYLTEL